MKKCLKSTLSILLAAVLLLTIVPFGASAAETTKLTFTASNKNAVPGETVDVDIVMTNNPGIASIGLNLGYDSDILTIENITFNSAMGGTTQTSQLTKNPAKLIWISSTSNYNGDATVATITFRVNGDITDNVTTNVELTYDPDDIYNIAEDNIDCDIVNGVVNVVAAVPGDINGDTKVNNKDVTRLLQYLAQWDVFVNAPTLDTNGDGKVNNKDVTRLMQYLAHWDVEIFVGSNSSSTACTHQLTKIDAVAASCEEDGNITYWHCEKCGKTFADVNAVREIQIADTVVNATGHTIVIDEAVPATYEHTGLSEGKHCSSCGKVIVPQETVPMLQKSEYSITYHVDNNDYYLKQQTIENTNLLSYTSEDGLELSDLIVPGYNFKGWYTAQTGGTLVTQIPVGSTGNKVFYAQWEKVEYTISFDSPDVPVDSVTYTVDRGITLTNPSWFGYTFVGWSNNGTIVNSIPAGTTGNITLHANWTSNRNKARAVSSLDYPSIIEDVDNGQYLFMYELGTIENVPLSQIEYIGNSQGININQKYVYSTIANSAYVNTVAEAVSNATTKTSGWVLSDGWNETTSATNSHEEQKGKTDERRDTSGNIVNSKYYVSNCSGGSTSSSSNSGGTTNTSSKVTTDQSTGINGNYYNENVKDSSVDLNVTAKVGAGWGPVSAEVSAGASTHNQNFNKQTSELATSRAANVGTENISNNSSYWNNSSGSSSNWNRSSGYESAKTSSNSTEIAKTLSEIISDRYSYTSTNSKNHEYTQTSSTADTSELKNEYVSTVEYSTEEVETVTKTITYSSNAAGYYRLINAGTVHVFAVVGYDIATSSYFTYTYNILDAERHEYLDYSKDNANFNDCENAILPFEVPTFVQEYVTTKVARSAGLTIDTETGSVIEYDGSAEYVIIPEYVSVDNGDGTYSAIRIEKIEENTFKGNNTIKGVAFPKYIASIPSNSFKGCINLNHILGYGISEIGENAFDGCINLLSFTIDNKVTNLGKNAFNSTSELIADAANQNVVNAVIQSGSKRILLNVSKMEGTLDSQKIVIDDNTDYFALMSNGTTYNNLQIESNASETFLSNFKISNSKNIPLKLSSNDITLNRLSVLDAPSIALIMTANNTNLKLFGSVIINSQTENAVISRSIELSKADSGVAGSLKLTGNYLVVGDEQIINDKMLSFTEGEVIHISEDQFIKMLTSSTVYFDANGGNVETLSKTVMLGGVYGDLPTPSKDYCNFEGWYSAPEGGTKIESDTIFNQSNDVTLYAHWTAKSPSDWVLASSLPEGAKVVEQKWSYTQREFTESGSSSLSGWTKYDTRRTGWGPTQGPVYYDPSNGVRNVWSESYVTSSNYKTVYHYYRYANSYTGGNGSYTDYYPNYYTYDFDYPLEETSAIGGHARYMYWYSDSNWTGVYACDPFTTQQWVSDNYGTRWYFQDPIYTYYYYRDVNKESTTEVVNGGNISNTQKWVKYIEK